MESCPRLLRRPGHQPETQGGNKMNLPTPPLPTQCPSQRHPAPSPWTSPLPPASQPFPVPSHTPGPPRQPTELQSCSETQTGPPTRLPSQDTHRCCKAPNRLSLHRECIWGEGLCSSWVAHSNYWTQETQRAPRDTPRAATWGVGHVSRHTTHSLLASVCDRHHV